jgi:LytR cell envelope-related transcriptional attenuator
VATSTLRFAIIVALVVGGIVLIDRAFPSPASGTAGIGPGATPSPSPSPSKPPKKSPKPKTTPTVAGAVVAVYNGTGVLGLAGDVQTKLMTRFGVVAPHDAANAPSPVAETTLYYRSHADQAVAQFLADRFFKDLPNVTVARLQSGTDVPEDVQVAVFVGNDYAALQG